MTTSCPHVKWLKTPTSLDSHSGLKVIFKARPGRPLWHMAFFFSKNIVKSSRGGAKGREVLLWHQWDGDICVWVHLRKRLTKVSASGIWNPGRSQWGCLPILSPANPPELTNGQGALAQQWSQLNTSKHACIFCPCVASRVWIQRPETSSKHLISCYPWPFVSLIKL